jgi:hypothetical protein
MRKIRQRIADFLHDNYKARRSWNVHDGWVFRFGPLRLKGW